MQMHVKVRVRDHEKDTPLYVLCRKWVQNDPEAELMPPKLLLLEETGDIVRESSAGSGVRGAGPKLPAVPAPSEEEERAERPAPEEPPLPQQQLETPTLEVRRKSYNCGLGFLNLVYCISISILYKSCYIPSFPLWLPDKQLKLQQTHPPL